MIFEKRTRKRSFRCILFAPVLILVVFIRNFFLIIADVESIALSSQSSNEEMKEPCALLFFGLVKEFQSIILPSIERSILESNRNCDVFLHTYNLTQMPINPRSSEAKALTLDVSEAYLLTNNDEQIMLEPLSSFHSQRDDILNHTKVNYHRGWGDCCVSHENMIKQWHSIQQVWNLMKSYERRLMSNKFDGTDKKIGSQHLHYYTQVGLFRSDVYYLSPINIFDSNAATGNFAKHGGYNDRFFYGNYKNAEIWASKRFDFVSRFEEKYMKTFNSTKKGKDGYHSETYLKCLLDYYDVPVEQQNICVLRVRSGPRIKVTDCKDLDQFNSWKKTVTYIPFRSTDYEPIA